MLGEAKSSAGLGMWEECLSCSQQQRECQTWVTGGAREGCCEVGGDWVPDPNSGLVAMVEADRMDCCGQPCAMLGEDAFWCMAAGWWAGAWGYVLLPIHRLGLSSRCRGPVYELTIRHCRCVFQVTHCLLPAVGSSMRELQTRCTRRCLKSWAGFLQTQYAVPPLPKGSACSRSIAAACWVHPSGPQTVSAFPAGLCVVDPLSSLNSKLRGEVCRAIALTARSIL